MHSYQPGAPTITLLDTSVCSKNLGDQIIMESVESTILSMFPSAFVLKVPTHEYIGKASYLLLAASDYVFVGGTNLLSSNMHQYNQWKLGPVDYFRMRNAILLGVGWWQYQKPPNVYTRHLLSRILNKSITHSARDLFTVRQLHACGIRNVLHTTCITLWDLSREHSALIPQEKAENVVLTFTDYMPHEPSDRVLFDTLRRLYKRIYIWLQGPNDYAYSQRITDNAANVEYVDPAVSALDELIHSGTDIDYVGTRLHAGIRCLKAGRRTLVIAIDNRAAEISRETNLPTVSRQELDKLSKKVAENWETRLTLPIENIDRWKDQFARPRKPQLSK